MTRKRIEDPCISAERIRSKRKQLGWTQKTLAEKCRLHLGTIKQYELGKRVPDGYCRLAIADALGVNERWLVGMENSKGDKMSNIEEAFLNPKPIEISGELSSNIFEIFKDIAATDEIKQKFKDVCVFMAKNKLQMMSLKGEHVSFNLEMVVDENAKEAADDREQTENL